MTILHPTDTTRRTGTTAIAPAVTYITPLVGGELYLWWVGSRYDPALPVLDAGITTLVQRTAGPATPGVGTGKVTLTIAKREIASAAEQGTDHNVTLAGGNVVAAQASEFTKAAGTNWDIAFTSGVKDAESTAWAVNGDAAISFAPGDWLVGYILANDSNADFPAVRQFLAAGITFSNNNTQSLVGQVAVGDGMYLVQVCAQVTAGTATVVPSLNATSSVPAAGAVAFVRLREVTPAGTAPSISTQPANQTVTVGSTATFTVVATGTGTLTYQWTKNGAAISGATASSYTTPATVLGDNGAVFAVTIHGDTAPDAVSNGATLTVNGVANALPSDAGGALVETNVSQTGLTLTGPVATDADGSVTGYDWSTDGGVTYPVTNWPAPTYNFAGLNPGTTYQFRRRARDNQGGLSNPPLAKAVTTLPAGATITSQPLKDDVVPPNVSANSPLTWVRIYSSADGSKLAELTGLSTNASGVFSALYAGGLIGQTYEVRWLESNGKQGFGFAVGT